MVSDERITLLLKEADAGRAGALDELMSAVYEDLERMAASHLRRQFGAQANAITLEPAALVNESFMRLIKQRTTYDNRGHFFAIATRVMLRVLIDYRRQRNALKRGGGETHITLALDEGQVAGAGSMATRMVEVEQLAEVLEKLESCDGRMADVVKMRVVWGLEIEEIATSLGISASTVKRDWRFARAWLAEEMGLDPT